MRQLTVIAFILLVVCHSEMVSQPCLPDGITFSSQSQIDSFAINYPNCTEILGWVGINGNHATITNLNGLNVLTAVHNDFEIVYNDSLESLIGLHNLEYVKWFNIGFNPLLQNLKGLNSLAETGVLLIGGNESMTTLDGIENLANTGYLEIHSNELLIDISALSSLNSISSGDLMIINNNSLVDLDGLENLDSIGGLLWIWNNEELQSLSGIDNIQSNTIDHLSIKGNPHLTYCSVKSICDYIANPVGNINFYANAYGCNTQAEVEDVCTVGISEIPEVRGSFAYPIPFTTSTTIEYELTDPTHIQLTIYNHLGEAIQEAVSAYKSLGVHTYEWKPDGLSKGMYFAVLRSGDGVSVIKMIKQ